MRILLLFAISAAAGQVPRTWTAAAVQSFEVPLANRAYSPKHISEELYYRIPERTIYKSYPVYHPDREPAGYQDWLKQQEPQAAFDAAKLKTAADWIAAGELVFQAPTSFAPMFFTADDLRDRAFYKEAGMPVGADGTVPFARWVIRKKGQVELGAMGCATCHTRVLDDGRIVPGAPSNNAADRQGARLLQRAKGPIDRLRMFARQFEVPWLPEDPNKAAREFSVEQFVSAGMAIPPGVNARAQTSILLPPQIPDLIGVKERRYLDHTGLIRQREIGDLMRYSTVAQDVGLLAGFGPDAAEPQPRGVRYSDAQLFALAQYLYSLTPPQNPNPASEAGRAVFEREMCGRCHTAPLYTNNKLIPVDGFAAPDDEPDVLRRKLGTDPRYALQTRKGTGYYKVPSLKGLWYRGVLEHHGSVATLEDWFDAARLREDYVPTGWRGYGVEKRAVPGHEFGLKLNAADKRALIAFLRSL